MKEWEKHTVVQLKKALVKRGLATSGRKAELVARLEEHAAASLDESIDDESHGDKTAESVDLNDSIIHDKSQDIDDDTQPEKTDDQKPLKDELEVNDPPITPADQTDPPMTVSDQPNDKSEDVAKIDEKSVDVVPPPEKSIDAVEQSEKSMDTVVPPEISLDSVAPPEISLDTVAPLENSIDAVVQSEESTDSVALPEKSMDTVAPPEKSIDAVAPPEKSMDTVAPPEKSIDAVAPPEKSMDTVAPPEESTGTVSPPVTLTEKSIDSVAPPEESIDALAQSGKSLDAVAPPEKSIDAVAQSEKFLDTVAPPEKSIDTVASPEKSIDAVAPPEESIDASAQSEESIDASAQSEKSSDTVAPSEESMDILALSETPIDAVAPSEKSIDTVVPSGKPMEVVAPAGNQLNIHLGSALLTEIRSEPAPGEKSRSSFDETVQGEVKQVEFSSQEVISDNHQDLSGMETDKPVEPIDQSSDASNLTTSQSVPGTDQPMEVADDGTSISQPTDKQQDNSHDLLSVQKTDQPMQEGVAPSSPERNPCEIQSESPQDPELDKEMITEEGAGIPKEVTASTPNLSSQEQPMSESDKISEETSLLNQSNDREDEVIKKIEQDLKLSSVLYTSTTIQSVTDNIEIDEPVSLLAASEIEQKSSLQQSKSAADVEQVLKSLEIESQSSASNLDNITEESILPSTQSVDQLLQFNVTGSTKDDSNEDSTPAAKLDQPPVELDEIDDYIQQLQQSQSQAGQDVGGIGENASSLSTEPSAIDTEEQTIIKELSPEKTAPLQGTVDDPGLGLLIDEIEQLTDETKPPDVDTDQSQIESASIDECTKAAKDSCESSGTSVKETGESSGDAKVEPGIVLNSPTKVEINVLSDAKPPAGDQKPDELIAALPEQEMHAIISSEVGSKSSKDTDVIEDANMESDAQETSIIDSSQTVDQEKDMDDDVEMSDSIPPDFMVVDEYCGCDTDTDPSFNTDTELAKPVDCSDTNRFQPTASGQEPTVSGQEPTVSGQKPTVSGQEPTASEQEPTVSGPEPIVSGPEPTVSGPEPTVLGPEPTVSGLEPVEKGLDSAPEPTIISPGPDPTVSGPEPTVSGPEPTVSGPEPTISGPEPNVSGPEPTISRPEPTISGPETNVSGPEPNVSGPEPTISGPEPTISEPEPNVSGLKQSISGSEPTTSGPEPTVSGLDPTGSGELEDTPVISIPGRNESIQMSEYNDKIVDSADKSGSVSEVGPSETDTQTSSSLLAETGTEGASEQTADVKTIELENIPQLQSSADAIPSDINTPVIEASEPISSEVKTEHDEDPVDQTEPENKETDLANQLDADKQVDDETIMKTSLVKPDEQDNVDTCNDGTPVPESPIEQQSEVPETITASEAKEDETVMIVSTPLTADTENKADATEADLAPEVADSGVALPCLPGDDYTEELMDIDDESDAEGECAIVQESNDTWSGPNLVCRAPEQLELMKKRIASADGSEILPLEVLNEMIMDCDELKVTIQPISFEDFTNLTLMDVMSHCSSCIARHRALPSAEGRPAFVGSVELHFKRRGDVDLWMPSLKAIKDDIIVTRGSAYAMYADFQKRVFDMCEIDPGAVLFNADLPDHVSSDDLWKLFPNAYKIHIAHEERHAYVMFPSRGVLDISLDWLSSNKPDGVLRNLQFFIYAQITSDAVETEVKSEGLPDLSESHPDMTPLPAGKLTDVSPLAVLSTNYSSPAQLPVVTENSKPAIGPPTRPPGPPPTTKTLFPDKTPATVSKSSDSEAVKTKPARPSAPPTKPLPPPYPPPDYALRKIPPPKVSVPESVPVSGAKKVIPAPPSAPPDTIKTSFAVVSSGVLRRSSTSSPQINDPDQASADLDSATGAMRSSTPPPPGTEPVLIKPKAPRAPPPPTPTSTPPVTPTSTAGVAAQISNVSTVPTPSTTRTPSPVFVGPMLPSISMPAPRVSVVGTPLMMTTLTSSYYGAVINPAPSTMTSAAIAKPPVLTANTYGAYASTSGSLLGHGPQYVSNLAASSSILGMGPSYGSAAASSSVIRRDTILKALMLPAAPPPAPARVTPVLQSASIVKPPVLHSKVPAKAPVPSQAPAFKVSGVSPALPVKSTALGQTQKLYVGNVPTNNDPLVTRQALVDLFNSNMKKLGLSPNPGNPVNQCNFSNQKYAFIGFRSEEETTNAMLLNGIEFESHKLVIRRPRDYIPPPTDAAPTAQVVDKSAVDSSNLTRAQRRVLQRTDSGEKTVQVAQQASLNYTIYPPPDPSKYQYDTISGYYYDPTTTLYYEAKSQAYFNSVTRQFMFYDWPKRTYLPLANQNKAAPNVSDHQAKQKKKEDKDVPLPKKIAAHMEKWAKANKKGIKDKDKLESMYREKNLALKDRDMLLKMAENKAKEIKKISFSVGKRPASDPASTEDPKKQKTEPDKPESGDKLSIDLTRESPDRTSIPRAGYKRGRSSSPASSNRRQYRRPDRSNSPPSSRGRSPSSRDRHDSKRDDRRSDRSERRRSPGSRDHGSRDHGSRDRGSRDHGSSRHDRDHSPRTRRPDSDRRRSDRDRSPISRHDKGRASPRRSSPRRSSPRRGSPRRDSKRDDHRRSPAPKQHQKRSTESISSSSSSSSSRSNSPTRKRSPVPKSHSESQRDYSPISNSSRSQSEYRNEPVMDKDYRTQGRIEGGRSQTLGHQQLYDPYKSEPARSYQQHRINRSPSKESNLSRKSDRANSPIGLDSARKYGRSFSPQSQGDRSGGRDSDLRSGYNPLSRTAEGQLRPDVSSRSSKQPEEPTRKVTIISKSTEKAQEEDKRIPYRYPGEARSPDVARKEPQIPGLGDYKGSSRQAEYTGEAKRHGSQEGTGYDIPRVAHEEKTDQAGLKQASLVNSLNLLTKIVRASKDFKEKLGEHPLGFSGDSTKGDQLSSYPSSAASMKPVAIDYNHSSAPRDQQQLTSSTRESDDPYYYSSAQRGYDRYREPPSMDHFPSRTDPYPDQYQRNMDYHRESNYPPHEDPYSDYPPPRSDPLRSSGYGDNSGGRPGSPGFQRPIRSSRPHFRTDHFAESLKYNEMPSALEARRGGPRGGQRGARGASARGGSARGGGIQGYGNQLLQHLGVYNRGREDSDLPPLDDDRY